MISCIVFICIEQCYWFLLVLFMRWVFDNYNMPKRAAFTNNCEYRPWFSRYKYQTSWPMWQWLFSFDGKMWFESPELPLRLLWHVNMKDEQVCEESLLYYGNKGHNYTDLVVFYLSFLPASRSPILVTNYLRSGWRAWPATWRAWSRE